MAIKKLHVFLIALVLLFSVSQLYAGDLTMFSSNGYSRSFQNLLYESYVYRCNLSGKAPENKSKSSLVSDVDFSLNEMLRATLKSMTFPSVRVRDLVLKTLNVDMTISYNSDYIDARDEWVNKAMEAYRSSGYNGDYTQKKIEMEDAFRKLYESDILTQRFLNVIQDENKLSQLTIQGIAKTSREEFLNVKNSDSSVNLKHQKIEVINFLRKMIFQNMKKNFFASGVYTSVKLKDGSEDDMNVLLAFLMSSFGIKATIGVVPKEDTQWGESKFVVVYSMVRPDASSSQVRYRVKNEVVEVSGVMVNALDSTKYKNVIIQLKNGKVKKKTIDWIRRFDNQNIKYDGNYGESAIYQKYGETLKLYGKSNFQYYLNKAKGICDQLGAIFKASKKVKKESSMFQIPVSFMKTQQLLTLKTPVSSRITDELKQKGC